jgi:predicted helicase
MDPQLQTLGLQLADTAVRHTAASVGIRISAVKAKKNNQETIAELEQIVNDLQSDRSELVRIAQAYEDELVAQRISNSDIEYISNSFVPALQQIIESAPASEGQDVATAQQVIAFLQPLLSVEMVTVLQLVGFNFRKAIGEPLTELIARLILAKAQEDQSAAQEIQRLALVRETSYLEVAQDPEAYARLLNMLRPQG